MKRGLAVFPLLLVVGCATSGEQNLSTLQAEVQVLKVENRSLQRELSSKERDLQLLRNKVTKLKAAVEDIEDRQLKQETGQIELRRKFLSVEKNSLQKISGIEEQLKRLKSFKSEVLDLRSQLLKAEDDIKRLKGSCQNMNSRISELESRLNTVSSKLSLVEKKLEQIRIPSIRVEKVKPEGSKK